MNTETALQPEVIKNTIYDIRGQKVMLDYDLAAIYGVKTGSMNQAVKRNIDRFPEDFMFRLTEEEWEHLLQSGMISQIVISSLSKRKKSSPPFAFTEHGAVMLASVLHSSSAVQMSVCCTDECDGDSSVHRHAAGNFDDAFNGFEG